MKALDTNILIRLLVGDDKKMMTKATGLLEKAHDEGEQFLVLNPVLLEMLWVLRSRYRLSREDILDALQELTLMPVLEFQSVESVRELIEVGHATQTDLADILIGLCARDLGCETTLTFDKRAAKSDLFQRL